MNCPRLDNLNIGAIEPMRTPVQMQKDVPHTPQTINTVVRGREAVEQIIDGDDKRLMAVVGPCSIHNLGAAEEYALRLAKLSEKIKDHIFVVMRCYFEKPRSSIGWKGFINDPYMNDTFQIQEGIRMARQFLLRVAKIGLPAATEVLDTLTPQYIGDLISWSVIGARTAEAQTHREMASGLSTPVGFKNATDGSLEVAVNAIRSAKGPHHFLGVSEDGLPAVFNTTGNAYPHVVLRGGKTPNYDAAHIAECEKMLSAANLPVRIMVDCSHGNSKKKPENQPVVLRDLLAQIKAGNKSIFGFMLESSLEWGNQSIGRDPSKLRPGLSVTDACIDWETTEELLLEAAETVASIH